MSASVATERPCPECGSTVPVATGYPDWCDCGWNLEPPATHPPTALRIELLEARPALPPTVTLNLAWSARIDSELAPLEREIARELLDRHRSALYYG